MVGEIYLIIVFLGRRSLFQNLVVSFQKILATSLDKIAFASTVITLEIEWHSVSDLFLEILLALFRETHLETSRGELKGTLPLLDTFP